VHLQCRRVHTVHERRRGCTPFTRTTRLVSQCRFTANAVSLAVPFHWRCRFHGATSQVNATFRHNIPFIPPLLPLCSPPNPGSAMSDEFDPDAYLDSLIQAATLAPNGYVALNRVKVDDLSKLGIMPRDMHYKTMREANDAAQRERTKLMQARMAGKPYYAASGAMLLTPAHSMSTLLVHMPRLRPSSIFQSHIHAAAIAPPQERPSRSSKSTVALTSATSSPVNSSRKSGSNTAPAPTSRLASWCLTTAGVLRKSCLLAGTPALRRFCTSKNRLTSKNGPLPPRQLQPFSPPLLLAARLQQPSTCRTTAIRPLTRTTSPTSRPPAGQHPTRRQKTAGSWRPGAA
jgi:hypothetical protein